MKAQLPLFASQAPSEDTSAADAPSIHFYRAGSWPSVAPAPERLLPPARRLAASLAPSRVSGPLPLRQVVIHANRRLSIALRPLGRAALEARLHWALLLDEALPFEALHHALRSGSFPPDLKSSLSALATSERLRASIPAPRPHPLQAQGRHHDLAALCAQVRARLPELGKREVEVGWARRRRARKGTRIRLGSAQPEAGRVSVHPMLDSADVPEPVLGFVVFHELCHLAAPPLSRSEAQERREHRIHHRHFRELERRWPGLEEAEAWLDRNISAVRDKWSRTG